MPSHFPRIRALALLALSTTSACAATVQTFSPRGPVQEVEQVRATFSEAMVAMADTRAAAPFEIECALDGSGHWIDERNWVWDVREKEDEIKRDAVKCEFKLSPSLRTLAGKPVRGTQHFSFKLPRLSEAETLEVGMRVPGYGEIVENQIFLLRFNRSLSTYKPALFCQWKGSPRAPVVELGEAEKKAKFLEHWKGYKGLDPMAVLAVRCPHPIPTGAKMRIGMERGGLKPAFLDYKVRPAFAAGIDCQIYSARTCTPNAPVVLTFNALVPEKYLAAIRLSSSAGTQAGIPVPGQGYAVSFAGPHPARSKLSISYPAELTDSEGRKAAAGALPASVTTSPPVPIVTFTDPPFDIARSGDSAAGLLLTSNARPQAVRQLHVGMGANAALADQEILRWLNTFEKSYTTHVPSKKSRTHARASLLSNQAAARLLPLPPPASEPATAAWTPRLAITGNGLHLMEMHTVAKGARGGPLFERTALLVTNLAVHLKLAKSGSVVWVTTLDTATPVAGAAVALYDCKNKNLWNGKTDKDGITRIEVALPKTHCDMPNEHITAIVRQRDMQGNTDMSLSRNGSNDIANPRLQNISEWHGRKMNYRASTVLDRSLFRPGETVSMRHLLRQESNAGLEFVPADELPKFAVIKHDESGKKWVLPLIWGSAGVDAASTFQLPANAALGNYGITLRHDPEKEDYNRDVSSGNFTVGAFRQPLMAGQVSTASETVPLYSGKVPALNLSLRYANGGGARNWPVQMRATLERNRASKKFGYHFNEQRRFADDPDWPLQEESTPLDTQLIKLDAHGISQFTLPVLPVKRLPYDLLIEVSYADPSGEQQTLTQRIKVWPAATQLGLVALGKEIVGHPMMLKALALDTKDVPQAGQQVQISARRDFGHAAMTPSGSAKPVPQEELGVVCEGKSDALGMFDCPYLPGKSGFYEFTASTRDAQGRVNTTSVFTGVAEGQSKGKVLFMRADRAQYAAGQTAHLRIDVPFTRATALLSIEREGILETRVIDVHGPHTDIALPVGPAWTPNVFVSLLAITPAGPAVARAMPDYAWGAIELKVGTAHRALTVKLETDKRNYSPRERATVRVRVTMPDGKPVPPGTTVAFAAVDEALLSLRENASWILMANMMHPRAYTSSIHSPLALPAAAPLDIQEREAIQRILGDVRVVHFNRDNETRHRSYRFDGDVAAGRLATSEPSQGLIPPPEPDEEPLGQHMAQRTRLENLLLWMPAVALDHNGDAVIDLPLNDALTRFRLVAVASVDSNYFGDGSINIDVVQDVQLSSGLPPVAHAGDRLQAMVTVRNASARSIALTVTARADGIAPLPARTVTLGAGDSQLVTWLVDTPGERDNLAWEFSAIETGKPGTGDSLAVSQRVYPVTPVTVQAATLRQLDAALTIPLALPKDALAGSGTVNLAFQSSLAGGMPGVRKWFERYAYTCLEQRASVAFGLQDKAAWNKLMAELPGYLDADGLVSYFPREPNTAADGSDSLSAYLLAMSDESGWTIPDAERKRMLDGLSQFAAGRVKRTSWAPVNDLVARKLAAVAALARHARATPALAAGLKVDADQWTVAMLTDWLTVLRRVKGIPNAAALQARAENQLRTRLTFQGTRMVFSTEKRDYWWWLMNNGDVDAARLLLAVRDLPSWRQDVPRIASGLLARQEGGAWSSTVANVWGTLAIGQFARQFETAEVTGQTAVTLGSVQKTAQWNAGQAAPVVLPLPQGAVDLHLDQKGGGKPWVSVQAVAAVPLTAPHFAGYRIEKSMTPVQQSVAGRVSVGDIWRVRLSVDAQADMTWVVLNDPVPAGVTILGKGLARDSATATTGEQASGDAELAYEERDFATYRSYYRFVPRGRFTQEYTIRINNAGTFALPPTRIEAMYAPDVFGALPNAPVQIFNNDVN